MNEQIENLKEWQKKSGLEPRKFIEQIIAPALLGPAPDWSKPLGYQLGRGAIFNAGAFCIFYGKDDETGEIVTFLHQRKEKNHQEEFKYGAFGGYVTSPEQSLDGVLRECMEEFCDDKGKPILVPDSTRLIYLYEGKDFKSKDPPVQYAALACEVSSEQIAKVKAYAHRLENDEAYRNAVNKKTGGETTGVKVMPLKDVVSLPFTQFTYHRQYSCYCEVARRLRIDPEKGTQTPDIPISSTPVGFSVSDMIPLHVSRIKRDGKNTVNAPAW